MTTHVSATTREEIPYVTETKTTNTTIISNALKRRAQSVINDTSIDPRWRTIVRYGLEINDPWLADLVRRADAGEPIIDTIDFSNLYGIVDAQIALVEAELLAGMVTS